MRSKLTFAMSIVGGLAVCIAAGASKAEVLTVPSPVGTFNVSTTQPWTTYSFSSPLLSAFTGVQFGNNQVTTVAQNSLRNVSGFAQVGNHLNAAVAQVGARNYSALAQVGRFKQGLVYQFGH